MRQQYAGYFGSRVAKTRCAFDWKDKKPVASIAEYTAFGESLECPTSRKRFNPFLWRRVAVLRREGETLSAALRLSGLGDSSSRRIMYNSLPEKLK